MKAAGRVVVLAACFLFYVATAQAASEWATPVSDLARKISDATGPGAVALEVTNRSSLSNAKVVSIKNMLRAELAASGIRLVDAEQAAATANVTLSENVREYVWVAEIQQGTNPKVVVLVATPRTDSAACVDRGDIASPWNSTQDLIAHSIDSVNSAVGSREEPQHVLFPGQCGSRVKRRRSREFPNARH